jgi:hypothetical protein
MASISDPCNCWWVHRTSGDIDEDPSSAAAAAANNSTMNETFNGTLDESLNESLFETAGEEGVPEESGESGEGVHEEA